MNDLARKNAGTRLAEQEFFLSYSSATNEQIKKLKEIICRLEPQQKEKIAEVLKIRRFREGLEKMRDDAKIIFIKEQEKLDQKAIDEGATVQFVRNSRN